MQNLRLDQTSTDLILWSTFLQHWYFHKEFMFWVSEIFPWNSLLWKNSRPSLTFNALLPCSKYIVIWAYIPHKCVINDAQNCPVKNASRAYCIQWPFLCLLLTGLQQGHQGDSPAHGSSTVYCQASNQRNTLQWKRRCHFSLSRQEVVGVK